MNDYGFYEVPVPVEELWMNNSIQLLINNTETNNGTDLVNVLKLAQVAHYIKQLLLSQVTIYS